MLRSGTVEIVAVALVFAALFALFLSYKVVRTDQMRGDFAMYLQGTENLAARGVPMSQLQAGILDYLNHNTYTTTPTADIAKNPAPLFGTAAPEAESSILLGHAYFILYPISLLVKVFAVRPVLLTLYVLSFIAMLVLAYHALRSKSLSVAAAAFFCLIIVTHPVWWQGLLYGQFYPDRFFIGLGMAFMWLASRERPRNLSLPMDRLGLVVAGLACAMINERGAIVSGLFLVGYAILYWRKNGVDPLFKAVFGSALVAYGIFAIKFIVPTDVIYGTFLPTNWAGVVATVQAPRFAPMVTLFVLVNLPLLVLAAFEWRAALIAVALMLPNIFGNIGGAEKLGWPTHYPTFYFVPLVWAALTGYARLFEMARVRRRLPAAYAVAAVAFLFLNMLNPSAYDHISLSASNLSSSAVPTLQNDFQQYVLQSELRSSLKASVDGIQQTVPEGSVVSSIEAGMPLLFHNRTVEFFPKDIDHADYAVLGASQSDGKIIYNGAVSALGAPELQKFNDLIVARMKRDGYDMDHPKLFPAYAGIAVVRRIRHKT